MKERLYKKKEISQMQNEEILTLYYNTTLNEHLISSVDAENFYEVLATVQSEILYRMSQNKV